MQPLGDFEACSLQILENRGGQILGYKRGYHYIHGCVAYIAFLRWSLCSLRWPGLANFEMKAMPYLMPLLIGRLDF